MKQATSVIQGVLYTLRYYESVAEVDVHKSGRTRPDYVMTHRHGQWVCTCPASRYGHHLCKHIREVPVVLAQDTIDEPWARWSEEYCQQGKQI